MQKNLYNKICFFVGILKVNDENRRIRIRIPIHLSEAWICGSESGSTPKCHGTATLAIEGILRISFLCVHLIMMEKLAQAIEYKVAVNAPADMADMAGVQFRASREKVVPPPPLCSLVLSPHTARGRVM